MLLILKVVYVNHFNLSKPHFLLKMVKNFAIIINTCLLVLLYCRKILLHSTKIFFNLLKCKILNILKQIKYDLHHFQNQGLNWLIPSVNVIYIFGTNTRNRARPRTFHKS